MPSAESNLSSSCATMDDTDVYLLPTPFSNDQHYRHILAVSLSELSNILDCYDTLGESS